VLQHQTTPLDARLCIGIITRLVAPTFVKPSTTLEASEHRLKLGMCVCNSRVSICSAVTSSDHMLRSYKLGIFLESLTLSLLRTTPRAPHRSRRISTGSRMRSRSTIKVEKFSARAFEITPDFVTATASGFSGTADSIVYDHLETS